MSSQSESSVTLQRQRNLLSHSRRYVPRGAYALAEQLKRDGVELFKVRGPWQAVRRLVPWPGRETVKVISVVTNGIADIAVDTAERAIDLSGLLNWCGIDQLEPVTNLRLPDCSELPHRSPLRRGEFQTFPEFLIGRVIEAPAQLALPQAVHG